MHQFTRFSVKQCGFQHCHGCLIGCAGQTENGHVFENRGGKVDDFGEAQRLAAEAVLHDGLQRCGAVESNRVILRRLRETDDGAHGQLVWFADAACAAERQTVRVDHTVSHRDRALVAVYDCRAAVLFPQGGLGRFAGARRGYEQDRFVAVSDDGGVEDEGVEKGQRVRQVYGGPEDLRADRVRFFGGQGVDCGGWLADFAAYGDEGDAACAVAEDAGVGVTGEDDLAVRERDDFSGGERQGVGGEEGERNGVRCGLGCEEEGVAVFDEGAVGQKAHGHPGDAVVVRHEAVLYGKCAHTMGRAGAISPGVVEVRS